MLLKRLKESHLDRNPCENREGKKKNTTVACNLSPIAQQSHQRDLGFFFLPCPSQHVVSNFQVISWSRMAAGAPTITLTFYE